MCLGGGGSSASRPHSEPARDVQNPKYSCWNTGAPGGNVIDGVWRQRPYLHLNIPVDLQSLHKHTDRTAATARQVGVG